jgi:hypothetical protein
LQLRTFNPHCAMLLHSVCRARPPALQLLELHCLTVSPETFPSSALVLELLSSLPRMHVRIRCELLPWTSIGDDASHWAAGVDSLRALGEDVQRTSAYADRLHIDLRDNRAAVAEWKQQMEALGNQLESRDELMPFEHP